MRAAPERRTVAYLACLAQGFPVRVLASTGEASH